MKIIFMGSTEFSLPILKALVEHKQTINIIAVYTHKPNRVGRGMTLNKSCIHLFAEEQNLPVFIPNSLKSNEEIEKFRALQPDIVVVAAYGLILRESILSIPKYGCINIHPSALPRWRGAAPLQRTIMSGDEETSVCIMLMDTGIDTGKIIYQQKLQIPKDVNYAELTNITANIGASLLINTLNDIISGSAQYIPQSEIGIEYAHKITKDDEKILWSMQNYEINNKIRAMSPNPGCYFIYRDDNIDLKFNKNDDNIMQLQHTSQHEEKIKILKAECVEIIDTDYDESTIQVMQPGLIIDDNMTIVCGEYGSKKRNFLRPLILQRAGKKVMRRSDFLHGCRFIKRGILLH